MNRPLSLSKKLGFTLFLIGGLFFVSQAYSPLHSADMSTVSVTLANPRLSFSGKLAAGNLANTTSITIDNSAGISSTNTNQLQEGDLLKVGALAPVAIKETLPPTGLSLVSNNTSVATGELVVATQSGAITVRFKTASAQNNGSIRVLIPSATTLYNDGLPDTNTFDYGTVAPTVTCPTSNGNYTFGAGAPASKAIQIGANWYHSFTCSYTGTGATNTDFTGTAALFTITGLVNPSPQISPTLHATGTADTYRVILQQLNSGGTVVDSNAVAIGVIEAVKVSAYVAPQITFSIAGIASGQTACGLTTSVTTTPAEVPFGELPLNASRSAAQTISVSTNANFGYAVTAVENDQMGLGGGACAADAVIGSNTLCIQDARGDGGTMSHTLENDWHVTTNPGFAFTLGEPTGSVLPTLPFIYSQGTGGCTSATGGGDCYRQFADAENAQVPQTIMSYSDVTNTQTTNVCYAINVGATQTSGSYENTLTYTATATF